MNVSCSICAELFRNPDALDLNVTPCGHIFHGKCLAQWLERKNTCPECRAKTIQSKVIRIFANIADPSVLDDESGPHDVMSLQSENDNLKFQLIEKDGSLRSKTETITRLQDDNKKLTTNTTQSRSIILTLEQKLETSKILSVHHNDQIKHLKTRLQEIDELKDKLKEANNKSRLTEVVHQMINGSQQETEQLLREHRTPVELATTVTTLKRELLNSQMKRSEIRQTNDELSKQLRLCNDEKSKLEEKCSIMESRLFQLENKNESMDCDIETNTIDKTIMMADKSKAADVISKPSLPKQSVRIDFGKTIKASAMNIRSSSIAGLSPLLKRTKSEESYKLSPLSNDRPETFSILKRPRLLNGHMRKPDIGSHRFTFKTVQK